MFRLTCSEPVFSAKDLDPRKFLQITRYQSAYVCDTDRRDLEIIRSNQLTRLFEFVTNRCVMFSGPVVERQRHKWGQSSDNCGTASIYSTVLFGTVEKLGTYNRASNYIGWSKSLKSSSDGAVGML